MFKVKSKSSLRQEHDNAVAEFLSQGKKITKCPTIKGTPRKTNPVKEVEIEVDFLPKALQEKFFKGV